MDVQPRKHAVEHQLRCQQLIRGIDLARSAALLLVEGDNECSVGHEIIKVWCGTPQVIKI